MISIIQAAGWPIWSVLTCSALALNLVFERFFSLSARKIAPPQVLESLMSASPARVPLLGLLGTVVGMIEIFGAQAGGASATDAVDPVQLGRGISIALDNTTFGLAAVLPALAFWRYFRSCVDAYVLQMALASERFARHLDRLRQAA